MTEKDWYRRSTWSDTDQADFSAHLSRCRSSSSKAQYLRIQALYLQETGDRALIRAALGLLQEVLRDYPEKSELASVLLQQGECLGALGHESEAIEALRKSLETQRRFPAARNVAHLVFGEAVLRLGRRALYSEVLETLAEFGDLDDLPIDQFRHQGIRASVLDALGRKAEAREAATLALRASAQTKSPLRNHPRFGLVGSVDPAIHKRLAAIAGRSERG